MRQDVGVDGDAPRISQLTWLFFLQIIDDQDQELEITRDDYRSPIPKRFQWRNWAADPEGIPQPDWRCRRGHNGIACRPPAIR